MFSGKAILVIMLNLVHVRLTWGNNPCQSLLNSSAGYLATRETFVGAACLPGHIIIWFSFCEINSSYESSAKLRGFMVTDHGRFPAYISHEKHEFVYIYDLQ